MSLTMRGILGGRILLRPLLLLLLTVVPSQGGTPLTGAEQTASVVEHNRWRRVEGANDMMEMKWDATYAASAATWAGSCVWKHDISAPETLRYQQTGQNMWWGSASLDVPGAIQAWYDEKQFYNYETKACTPGQMCGHYTQVVWAESYLMGCGKKACSPLLDEDGTTVLRSSATLLVCNYGPSGNQNSEPYPFYKGEPCSNCTNWKGYCRDKLCHNCDTGNCDCPITCKNCGTLKNDTCACDCPQGWGGQDCSLPCENVNDNCGTGWPSHVCGNTPYYNYILRQCPETCGKCKKGPAPPCDQPEATTRGEGGRFTLADGVTQPEGFTLPDGLVPGGGNSAASLSPNVAFYLFLVVTRMRSVL